MALSQLFKPLQGSEWRLVRLGLWRRILTVSVFVVLIHLTEGLQPTHTYYLYPLMIYVTIMWNVIIWRLNKKKKR